MNDNFEKTAFLLKCLMDNMSDNIYFKDLDSRFILLNQSMSEWQGAQSVGDLIGKSDFDLFAEEHAQQAFEDEQEIIRTGKPILAKEEKETWPDGRVTWVSSTKMPLKNDEGDIIGTFGISRDITAHKEAELRAARYAAEVKRYAEELKRINEDIEEELRMAGELQKAFFPASYPEFLRSDHPEKKAVDFYHLHHAGGLIGGDLCTILKLSDTRAGIFMCDVMGHGVRAALGTAIIRALVDDTARTEADPAKCLEHMNGAMIPVLRSSEEFVFATACYMILDVDSGALQMANAGHPVPLLLERKGKVTWSMEEGQRGPALAILDEAVYESVGLQLNPGDGMVMFTDGIFEISAGDDEEFGEARLLESFRQYQDLPLNELFPSVLKEARLFAGEKAFDDDVCLVGFRLSG
jgi:sigma-B regulation protein RsbU (phosphoserine phosphatase)